MVKYFLIKQDDKLELIQGEKGNPEGILEK